MSERGGGRVGGFLSFGEGRTSFTRGAREEEEEEEEEVEVGVERKKEDIGDGGWVRGKEGRGRRESA